MPEKNWKRELTDIVRREMKEMPAAHGMTGAPEPAAPEAEDRFVYTVTAADGEMTVKQILKDAWAFPPACCRS